MNRFFINQEQIDGRTAVITGEDAKHISRVLRMERGDRVILCDGANAEYQACVEQVDKDRVVLRLIAKIESKAEPRTNVTLFQGLPKAGKLEAIIQKCVELGVSEIVPVAAKRSVVRMTKKDFAAKLERYQRVAYEAAKQSGRGIIPKVCALVNPDEIDPTAYGAFLLPYEQERQTTLKKALQELDRPESVGIMIGPEGGFDPDEVKLFERRGALCVTLGSRILRTETAGPAVLAMLLYEFEGDE